MNPPFEISAKASDLLVKIGVELERLEGSLLREDNPRLRRANQIKTIQASLEIEQNTLSLEQVTAVIEGKRVLGSNKEIKEVKNANAVYERLTDFDPFSIDNMLEVHELLMIGLIESAGEWRKKGVGVMKGEQVVHIAPPADNVAFLMKDLFAWLESTDAHPLIASSVFHYEFEFIHPFADGNGRMGRFWQSLILNRWSSAMSYLSVESIIRDRQQEYYDVLALCDRVGKSTAFVDFILSAIYESFSNIKEDSIAQVSAQVSAQVKRLLKLLLKEELSQSELMKKLKLNNRTNFRKSRLSPALEQSLIEMTQPDSPRSPTQKYRLTEKGRAAL